MSGKINRSMIVGKGSLFLGRMTNLFDGVSFIMQKNSGGGEESGGVSEDAVRKLIAESLRELARSMGAE
jgi:hypothetical protein